MKNENRRSFLGINSNVLGVILLAWAGWVSLTMISMSGDICAIKARLDLTSIISQAAKK